MKKNVTRSVLVMVVLAAVLGSSGCTNWKKKYQGLDVEYQNLKGLYDNCVTSLDGSAAEKARLGQQLNDSQQTIDQLQSQIEERNISPGQASGFGEGMDVAFDAEAGTITVTLPNAILFASGKASLKKATSAELDHIYSVLRERYTGKEIEVVGHTDTDPIKKSKWKDNWELSAQRSLTVLRYLVKRGVPSERIKASAAGESRPIASNANSSGKSRNRRVEIVVHMR